MRRTFSIEELHDVLTSAKNEVKILGCVPLDLQWPRLMEAWSRRARRQDFHVSVLLESDNQLFAKSFMIDTDTSPHRRSFPELLFIRDEALRYLLDRSFDIKCDVRVLHLNIPISVVQVDDRAFAAAWLYSDVDNVDEILGDTPSANAMRQYCEVLFSDVGLKYAAGRDEELLELFDHNRVPRGIYPRHSFYDTDYSQVVVWALVFDRYGRLLIHRRAANATDNRGMWDKSVGGHADYTLDIDTSRAAAREVVEELFTDEVKKRSDFTAWTVTDSDIVYLGEWRPDKRREAPFNEIATFGREWCYFRLRESYAFYSPRLLPDRGLRRLRVIADVFLFVANSGLREETLGKLSNSRFRLLELAELKTILDRAVRGEEIPGFDEDNPVPAFTPDLVNILTGRLRDVLEEFSVHVRRYCG